MLQDDTRRKIENITKGIILDGTLDNCTSVRNHLASGFETSTTVKTDFETKSVIKKEQAIALEAYCEQHNLWVTDLPGKDRYLTRGGEAEVYLDEDGMSVIKLNDAVYYATWLEFLNAVLTTYNLLGFTKKDHTLFAVLKQPFVVCDEQAELGDIKKFLEFNGFVNTRRQDYAHHGLGLILEDMHDENVLVCKDTLFFIDTVFYTVSPVN